MSAFFSTLVYGMIMVLTSACGDHHDNGEAAPAPVLQSRTKPTATFVTQTSANANLTLAGEAQIVEIDLLAANRDKNARLDTAPLPTCLTPFPKDTIVGELVCLGTAKKKALRALHTRQVCAGSSSSFKAIEPLAQPTFVACKKDDVTINIFTFSPSINARLAVIRN